MKGRAKEEQAFFAMGERGIVVCKGRRRQQ
jgi:hypothetical protein